jgi:CSLREA domain-containing protein
MIQSLRVRSIPNALRRIAKVVFVLTLLGILFASLFASPAHAVTTFTVNSTNDTSSTCDASECTLREAISAANVTANSGGPDEIKFNIPGSGVHTIAPSSALPDIIDSVTIDGYTQPPTGPGPEPGPFVRIELSGANAGPSGVDVDGLVITASNSTVKGLAINGWSGRGIVIAGSGTTNNKVEGNFIGTDASGGGNAPGNSSGGVDIGEASNNTVGGKTDEERNIISNNGVDGVSIVGADATGNRVEGNFIGTDKNGTADLGNSFDGVRIAQGASNNTVGGLITPDGFLGNVISGNDGYGVSIMSFTGTASKGNKVEGNFIGTDKNGTADLGNTFDGVTFAGDASANTIGGTPDLIGARNVISGNDHGVSIFNAGATGNQVQGNLIGTDKNGTNALGNSSTGVYITDAPNNAIGGTTDEARNIISGNHGDGVVIDESSAASGNKVEGNYVGTDAAGTADLGNKRDGVVIYGAPNNTVGGTVSGARNVISGNDGYGVTIGGPTATGNQAGTKNKVEGNYIGTKADGTAGLGNTRGGVAITGASKNTVGGTAAGAGNVISSTLLPVAPGISINGAAKGNRILSNSIDANGSLGIDLGTDGVTKNDKKDPDKGPNNLQNFPVISSAKTASGTTTIKGTLNSRPGATFTIQFFSSPQADPSGFGEGKKFLGQKMTGLTSSSGNASFKFTAPAVALGEVVTATATNNPGGNTSEFSKAIISCGGPPDASTC